MPPIVSPKLGPMANFNARLNVFITPCSDTNILFLLFALWF